MMNNRKVTLVLIIELENIGSWNFYFTLSFNHINYYNKGGI